MRGTVIVKKIFFVMQVAVPVSALGANCSSFCQALVSIFSPFYERFVRKTGSLEVTELSGNSARRL